MDIVKLKTTGKDPVTLCLHNSPQPYTVEDVLNTRAYVYDDKAYELEMELDQIHASISVYLNDELVEGHYEADQHIFVPHMKSIFRGHIGFVQLAVEIIYSDDRTNWLFSDMASILLKDYYVNSAVNMMIKYIYEHHENALFREVSVTGISKKFDASFDDFWSQLLLFEEIAKVYEESYGYFKANARYRLEKVEVLDRTEKLQYVDSKTLQYISQHPEYLKRETNGIKYGRQSFLPTKTLMVQNRITNDTYENRVVYGFIKRVASEAASTRQRIKDLLHSIDYEEEIDGYIVSSSILYNNATHILQEYEDRIENVESKLQTLFLSYERLLDVEDIQLTAMPKATPVFMNLPQYNRIYLCIYRWYGKTGYDFEKEKLLFNFFTAPAIYEAYVLVKLLSEIKSCGFEIQEAKTVTYPKRERWLYKNKEYNNTYILSDGNRTVTLYYEPIIYDDDRSDVNRIFLYRNNGISLKKEYEEERFGSYYVPDFVIKLEDGEKEHYFLCDAKFTNFNRVRGTLIPELAYKYLTSISSITENADIVGLYVFYGLIHDKSVKQSFYSNRIDHAPSIKPKIEMIPLSEYLSPEEQHRNLSDMLMVE